MEEVADWDLQAVVRAFTTASSAAATTRLAAETAALDLQLPQTCFPSFGLEESDGLFTFQDPFGSISTTTTNSSMTGCGELENLCKPFCSNLQPSVCPAPNITVFSASTSTAALLPQPQRQQLVLPHQQQQQLNPVNRALHDGASTGPSNFITACKRTPALSLLPRLQNLVIICASQAESGKTPRPPSVLTKSTISSSFTPLSYFSLFNNPRKHIYFSSTPAGWKLRIWLEHFVEHPQSIIQQPASPQQIYHFVQHKGTSRRNIAELIFKRNIRIVQSIAEF